MLAFAPDFDTAGISLHVNTSIGEELSGAFAELLMVRTFFDGDFKVGKEATKEFFMEHAGDYKYIHLATHAVIDQNAPDASHLVFTPNGRGEEHNRLEAHELYTMQIPALLVTLSACNTGVGKMEPGEGAASLAKAFIYAGAENVLMSLWPVDDVITAELMRHFYRFFDKTRNPSYALSQAKREFVATHPGVLKHPYYWSGFVLISSRWNQVVARVSYLWLLPFLCTLLLGGFIYWRVRLK